MELVNNNYTVSTLHIGNLEVLYFVTYAQFLTALFSLSTKSKNYAAKNFYLHKLIRFAARDFGTLLFLSKSILLFHFCSLSTLTVIPNVTTSK